MHDDEKVKMKENLDAKEAQLEAFKENYVRNFTLIDLKLITKWDIAYTF